MVKEGIFVCFLDNSKSVIHTSFPDFGVDGDVARALVSRSSINRLATIGLKGDPIAAALTCFIDLALECEVGGVQTKFQQAGDLVH